MNMLNFNIKNSSGGHKSNFNCRDVADIVFNWGST